MESRSDSAAKGFLKSLHQLEGEGQEGLRILQKKLAEELQAAEAEADRIVEEAEKEAAQIERSAYDAQVKELRQQRQELLQEAEASAARLQQRCETHRQAWLAEMLAYVLQGPDDREEAA